MSEIKTQSSTTTQPNEDVAPAQTQPQPSSPSKDVAAASNSSSNNNTASSVVLNPPTVTITNAAGVSNNNQSPTQSRSAASASTPTAVSSSLPPVQPSIANIQQQANTSTSSITSSSTTSSSTPSPNTSHQNLQPLTGSSSASSSNLNPTALSASLSLANAQNSTYHAEEVQFAFENKKTLKRLLKISKHWTDSMKVYCQNSHLFSEEMIKQSEQMIAFAQPKEKTLGGNLAFFGNTLKAVNSVHDQMLNEIQDVFCTPVANFVDYDFAEVAESHKRLTKSKEEYEQSLGKISTSIKKSKQGIDETRLFNYEQELEKLKEVLENQNKDLETKLAELSYKNEIKYLRSVLHFINAQYLFFNRGAKLLGGLKPRIEELERYLEEIQPPKVVEGHLMKKSKQVMGGWNKCWYVLKDGMLYCYKGKKEFHPENALNILLCSVRVPQQTLVASPSTNPPTKEQVDYRFEILHPRKKQPIVLQAENEEERDRWVTAIQEAISNSLNSQPIEKSSLNSSFVSGSGKPLANSTLGASTAAGQTGDEVNQQVMRIIQKASGNNICADCSSQDPDWASINLGVIICKVCSGVHRSLGTHISKVRSLTLDKWVPENISLMKEIGNAKFNMLYEHNLSDTVKPLEKSDRMTKEAYIRSKYKTKDFLIKSTLPQEELSKMLYEMASSTTGARDVSRYLKLIGQGAEVNFVDTCGRTTLHQVIWKSDDVIIPELLLQNGADITMVDSRGWTPMHYAAYFNRPRCASLLMKRGYETIRLKCMDHLGRLPIDLAVLNRSKETEQILKSEEISLGLTMDNIEAGTVQPFEASTPLSTEFPNATLNGAREEILSEDDEDNYNGVENAMESSWSESERESVGRASFSGVDGNESLSSSHHPNSIQLNASINSTVSTASGGDKPPISATGSGRDSSNNLNANNKSSETLDKSSNNTNVVASNSTAAPTAATLAPTSTSAAGPEVPVNQKLNRPKSKRRPSLLGRGKNTLRLMKSKLSISGKGINNTGESGDTQSQLAHQQNIDENGYEDDSSDEEDNTTATTEPIPELTTSTTNQQPAPLPPTSETLSNLVHRESMDNVHNKPQTSLNPHTQPPSHSNSYNDLISAEDEKDKSSPNRQQPTSPTPFKMFLKKFKGMTKKPKDKDKDKDGTHSDSMEDEPISDIPDNVSTTTNDETSKSELSDFARKKKKKEKSSSTNSSPTTAAPTVTAESNNNLIPQPTTNNT